MSGALQSAIYKGHIRHRRFSPKEHAFTMPIWMLYLDLEELEDVFSVSRWWSDCEFAPAQFRRGDYLGDASIDLDSSVRAEVEQQLGFRPTGPIRVLTHIRQFGYVFNPVTFYYCFDKTGTSLDAIVAQITNTPWKERHAYTLDARNETAGTESASYESSRFQFTKSFHVSPFFPMDLAYDWSFSTPHSTEGSSLGINMILTNTQTRVFDALLRLDRVAIDERSVRDVITGYPFLTARVIARIHLEALKLWIKGVPVSPHPGAASERPVSERTVS